MTPERIIQIMPAAPGWYAKYETPETPLALTFDLVAWALVERVDDEGESWQEIEGQIVEPIAGVVVSAEWAGLTQAQGHKLQFIGYGRDG